MEAGGTEPRTPTFSSSLSGTPAAPRRLHARGAEGLSHLIPTHTQRAEGVLACSVVSGEVSEGFTAPGHRPPPAPATPEHPAVLAPASEGEGPAPRADVGSGEEWKSGLCL